MSHFELNATVRESLGKSSVRKLNKQGKIPAVYYGGEENLHVAIEANALNKAVSGERGYNTLIKLKVDGKGDFDVLLKDYQADPIKRNFIHADLIKVDADKEVHLSVPVKLTGRSIGVKAGGILDHMTRELVVTCLPTSIPNEIVVDVTNLDKGDILHLHDIQLPEGVSADSKTDVVIAAVSLAREDKTQKKGGGDATETESPVAEGEKKE